MADREWLDVTKLNGERIYIRGRCLHHRIVDVESVLGEVVARLCIDCDTQLAADFISPLSAEVDPEHGLVLRNGVIFRTSGGAGSG